MSSLHHLDIELEVGQVFSDFTAFKQAVLQRAVLEGAVVRFPISDTKRVVAKCALADKGCNFHVRASRSVRTGEVNFTNPCFSNWSNGRL